VEQPIKLSIAATSKRVDIANVVALSFFNNAPLPRRSQLDVAMGWRDSPLGGTGPALLVGRKKHDFGFGNPVGLTRMAYLGRGFYRKKIPLRAIGVFPTWDRLIFAVHKRTGIESIEDIKKRQYPLRISTRRKGKLQTTLYVIEEVLRAYGIRLADIAKWGGEIIQAAAPSSADRMNHIRSGKADAVFDEGVKSWGGLALQSATLLCAAWSKSGFRARRSLQSTILRWSAKFRRSISAAGLFSVTLTCLRLLPTKWPEPSTFVMRTFQWIISMGAR
jgi:hypothetical protein